jgi:hypothetical protein
LDVRSADRHCPNAVPPGYVGLGKMDTSLPAKNPSSSAASTIATLEPPAGNTWSSFMLHLSPNQFLPRTLLRLSESFSWACLSIIIFWQNS